MTRGVRAWVHAALTLSLTMGALLGLPAKTPAAAAQPDGPADKSVPVANAPAVSIPPLQLDAGVTKVDRVVLPGGGAAELATNGAMVDVGGLPVAAKASAVSGDDFLSGARVHNGVSSLSRVKVAVADAKLARVAGVQGVVLSLSRVDGGTAGGTVDLAVDYTGFSQLYGANFGDRLRLVQLPACVLATPENKLCQTQLDLGSVNAAGKVSAQVVLSDPANVRPMPKAVGGNDAAAVPLTQADGPAVFAVTAGGSSAGATFESTSLSPVYSWAAGSQGGSFSWDYPLEVPEGLGGPEPKVSLSYDSGSVDAKTLAQNGQASWVGEGWELQAGGYIERSYRSCEQDGATGTNVADLCWFSPHNATLVLGGKSFKLIRDNASGMWKTDDDNGWRIEHKTGGSLGNGDNDDEHWVVTMLDGTQYWFGKHKRYTADTQVTNSVQSVPVWGDDAGEPCYATWCMQGYRWNLDYVHDLSGNSMTYFYTKWRGFYGFNNNCCGTVEYDISSTLDHIDYGTRVGSEAAAAAPMQVVFGKANRCVGSCQTAEYLDTPYDQHCTSSSSCAGRVSPTFWTPYRLAQVYTQVRKADGSGYRKVNQWDLAHSYPATGDNILPAGDDTSPNLWLDSLTHTGYAADGVTTLAEPAITFGRTGQMYNRVDWGNDIGVAPYTHYRLAQIDNGTGGRTVVTYSAQDCPLRSLKPAPGYNPFRCFPQHFKPAQAPAGYGWFHKYVATTVTEKDLTAAATPDEVWSYSYGVQSSTDGSLWAHDFNETTVLDYRTWSLWRGYSDVTTMHGPTGGTQTVDKAVFHRGLDGDSQANADNTAMVWEARRAGTLSTLDKPKVASMVSGRGGVCLDLANWGTANGTVVQSYHCTGDWNQKWVYNLDDFSFKNPQSGRCLQANSTGIGASVVLWDCNGTWGQQWQVTPEGGLRNPTANRCLDLTNYWTLPNGTIQLYDCTGTWNQVWQVQATGNAQGGGPIFSPQANRCADADSTANNAKVRTRACHAGTNPLWEPQANGDLFNPASSRCLDIENWGTANGTGVQLYQCTGDWNQKWKAHPDGTLRNPQSGKCLDSGASAAIGTQLMIWDCNGNLSQQWAARITDLEALQGKPFEAFDMDGSQILGSAIHTYTVTHTGTRPKPVTGGQDLKSFMARETDTKTRTWIAATGSWRWTREATTYDTYGLPATRRDYADMAITTDDTCVNPAYNRNTTLHLIDTVKEEVTTSCGLQTGDADVLEGRHYFYDNATTDATPTRGLLTKTEVIAAVSGGVKTWKQDSRSVYDTNGRPIEEYDALNRKTATAYTPSAGGPVTAVAETGPMGAGWTVTTDVEPGHGVPTKVTDVNGKTTTAEYDPLGRLTKLWRDNRATSTTPNVQYTYNLSTSPSWVRTQTLGPNGNQISSYEIYDGNLNLRQTQTPTESGQRRVVDVQYDGRGLQAKESDFFNNASAPTSTLVTFSDTNIERQLRFEYDRLARRTKEQLFKNNVLQFESTNVYDGDRAGVIPPSGGTVTQELYDARGRLAQKRQYHGTTLSGSHDLASYGYDRTSQLISVTDSGNNTRTYEYDLRGRQTKEVDPDAGTSLLAYDDAGQLLSVTDARGQALFYEYDLLGRKTKQRDGSAAGPVMAEWTYDTVLKGQQAASVRHIGSDQYIKRITSWDDGYQPLHLEVSVPNATVNGGLAATYAWDRTYKVDGSPATVVLPGVGGLPTETLTYTYDNNGYAQGIAGAWTGGSQVYLADNEYNYDGLISKLRLGASGQRVLLDHHYSGSTRRLTSMRTWLESPTTPGNYLEKFVHDYAYDAAGNITSAAGKTDGVADQTECFRYDHLRRLNTAWTQATLGTGCTTPQKAGADPYWREWTFDSIGNRLTQTDKDPGGNTTWTYTVGSAGSVKPHQLKQVTATGPAATPTRTFGYDQAGNLTSATTTTGAAQTLTWDKEGSLESVTEAANTTTYLYDADGNRLITRAPSKTTLYLPDGTELELASGGGSPLGTRYYNGIAVRTASGLKWMIPNHQGTSIAQIDAVTLAATRRRILPYGEDRGTQPTGWIGTKGYVGGTKEATGYTHLGAREYDPTLGRFLSPDPLFLLGVPQQWHAYAYSNNSPITFSDPSGTAFTPFCDCIGGGGFGFVGQSISYAYARTTIVRSAAGSGLSTRGLRTLNQRGTLARAGGDLHGGRQLVSRHTKVERQLERSERSGKTTTADKNKPTKPDKGGNGGGKGNTAKPSKGTGQDTSNAGTKPAPGGPAGQGPKTGSPPRSGTSEDKVVNITLGPTKRTAGISATHGDRVLPHEERFINWSGDKHGCWSCPAKTSGWKDGHWTPDHNPPYKLAPKGPWTLLPQCKGCSRTQGGVVNGINREWYRFDE